jgi:hypothetical protein
VTLGRSREKKEREAASRLDNRREVQVLLAHAAAVPMRDGSSWCVLAAWVNETGVGSGEAQTPMAVQGYCCVERRMLTNPSFTRTRTPS